MDEVKLIVFGKLEEVMGKNELVWSLPIDVRTLRHELENKFPPIRKVQFAISINNKIVSDDVLIKEGDKIALLPPFSGG
jgi:sulfur-carrier protein